MKVKDLEKAIENGTRIAVVPFRYKDEFPALKETSADRQGLASGQAHEVTVVAVREPRRVYSGQRWDFTGHTSNTGVRVRDTLGREHVLKPREVVAPVEEYLEARDSRQNAEQAKKDRLAAEKAAAESLVRAAGFGRVAPTHGGSRDWVTRGWHVEFSASEAKRLAERLEGGAS